MTITEGLRLGMVGGRLTSVIASHRPPLHGMWRPSDRLRYAEGGSQSLAYIRSSAGNDASQRRCYFRHGACTALLDSRLYRPPPGIPRSCIDPLGFACSRPLTSPTKGAVGSRLRGNDGGFIRRRGSGCVLLRGLLGCRRIR